MILCGSICSYAADRRAVICEAGRDCRWRSPSETRRTEAMIRQLGERGTTGPSGVIGRLAEKELATLRLRCPRQEYRQRRMQRWDDLDGAEYPASDRGGEARDAPGAAITCTTILDDELASGESEACRVIVIDTSALMAIYRREPDDDMPIRTGHLEAGGAHCRLPPVLSNSCMLRRNGGRSRGLARPADSSSSPS